MTTYYVGTEFDSVTPLSDYSGTWETTDGATDGIRGSVAMEGAGGYTLYLRDPATNLKTTASVLWTHFRAKPQVNPDNMAFIQWINSSGQDIVDIYCTQGNNNPYYVLRYWNGSTMVQVGSIYNWPQVLETMDVRIKIDASVGAVEWYVNGVLQSSIENIDTTAMGQIASVNMLSSRTNYPGTEFQQVILASYSTIGHQVRRRNPSANGSNTAWTGDYTAVNDFATGATDTTSITSSTPGDKETFTGSTLDATPQGMIIKAVAVAAAVRIGPDGGPQNVKPLMHIAGTDYEHPASYQDLSTSVVTGNVAVWQTNPSTGAAWESIDEVNATEFGVESAA